MKKIIVIVATLSLLLALLAAPAAAAEQTLPQCVMVDHATARFQAYGDGAVASFSLPLVEFYEKLLSAAGNDEDTANQMINYATLIVDDLRLDYTDPVFDEPWLYSTNPDITEGINYDWDAFTVAQKEDEVILWIYLPPKCLPSGFHSYPVADVTIWFGLEHPPEATDLFPSLFSAANTLFAAPPMLYCFGIFTLAFCVLFFKRIRK